jgi:hypothetical protein
MSDNTKEWEELVKAFELDLYRTEVMLDCLDYEINSLESKGAEKKEESCNT